MTTTAVQDKALLVAPKLPDAPASQAFVEVARKYKVSPIAQFREMIKLRMGPRKIDLHEYFTHGLYDPDMTWEEKTAYVGQVSTYRTNCKMSPLALTLNRPFVRDKVMYSALLNTLGIRSTVTQAVASPNRKFGGIAALATPQDVHRFLTSEAEYPVFGKPCEGSGSFGSALLSGIEDDMIVLGNGQRVPLDRFCNEIFDDYPDGFMFQTALRQHETLNEIAGNAVGSLRFVTIRDQDTPRRLYALWKVPSPNAMSDNFWQDGSILVQIDENGVLGEARMGTGTRARSVDKHPVSERAFKGVQIPHWDELQKTCIDAHALYPEFGVVGWDIAVTEDGPTIIENNANPYHSLYQLAYGRGFLNPEFAPAIERAAEISDEMLKTRTELEAERRKARKS